MLLVYGACNENATRAKIAHAEKYPERNQPLRRMFQRLYHSLLEIESFNVNKRKCNKTIMNETNIVVVLGAVTRNLNISICQQHQQKLQKTVKLTKEAYFKFFMPINFIYIIYHFIKSYIK